MANQLRTAAENALNELSALLHTIRANRLSVAVRDAKAAADALRAALAAPAAQSEPAINYFTVQDIATARRLDYNALCAALRDYLAMHKGAAPAAPSVPPGIALALAATLQGVRDHMQHWCRGGIDESAIACADAALRDWAAAAPTDGGQHG